MKLFQFRFVDFSPQMAGQIGAGVERMLRERGDMDLAMQFRTGPAACEQTIAPAPIDQVGFLVARAMTALALREKIDYSHAVVIRSNRTCRLIVPEDDGVLRIRLPHDDEIPEFFPLVAHVDDVSRLLIETDLFDYF